MDSKLGVILSMIWISIWGARKLFSEWRVGNGKLIDIWSDRELPKSSSLIRQCPLSDHNKESKVEELINKEEGCWKMEVIKVILEEEMIDIISILPFSKLGLDEILMWEAIANGKFIVKSTYNI